MSDVSFLEDAFHGLLPFEQDEIAQAYQACLEFGLPESNAESKHILILGCGIAGMVSAALLRKAGHRVTIVEGNTRVGGRIRTFRNTPQKRYFEDDHLSAEAGAMRIPDQHKLVQYLIDSTGVQKQLFLNKSISRKDALSGKIQQPDRDAQGNVDLSNLAATGNNLVHVNRRHVLRKNYELEGSDINELLNYDLNANEKFSTASELLEKAIGDLVNQVHADPKTAWPQIIEKYGEYSMRRFLKEAIVELSGNEHLSENALEMIGVIENLESRMSYSFIQSFIELAIIRPDTAFWLIQGGTDKFTQAYYDQENLDDVTYLNQTVNALYLCEETGKVKIKTEVSHDIADRLEQDQAVAKLLSERSWDEAIVTIPFSSFRMVQVWPEISQEKRKAVRELHYDAATKVLLEFRERFWETRNEIYGGGSVTDLPNRFMYYPSERMGSSKGGVMLASYSWADDARKWDSMSDYDRYCYALNNVAIVHADHEPGADYAVREAAQQKIRDLCVFDPKKYKDNQDNIVGAATVSWMNDPYAFGEAAIFYPGQLHLLHKAIIQSEWPHPETGKARLHFAGEHASLKHAWIEGAVESAVNAALLANENELPTLKRG
ncbi:FAD-dependent oxidoreductase [Photobacterium sp. 1_MG-2023]|uniref:flavin monoamine oxidase family protein n=1 Tax=Photobacterium sp. 1_MG-2023 TaxID=3062646 RepID=UPI0026E3497A|nr:FAD-dependent oxidoreductase [Photobacterium sp. 1_MG-2023]MDO6704764.1 FAD-dependent oxidoreductase [Photobacterium sp. 1_MG-2023]